ncbi:YihY/virulence factor BrkB family protein [Sphingomonas solaris]|uniref:YihY/virulence factor BrkB family protein n=1 Tax=Alterirhizorhabdus solaris TaxID=2529389 RepID=A0A558RB06_9SPHN|nr:YihY/virulence factor BrkB family protein [Sphingomonas solaris]TVV76462.1 YihY/virulence factor BrkB family protein [Sphingomonas solaris]
MAKTTSSSGANGRDAISPWTIPPSGWKEVVLRSWKEAGQDNISLVASGVAFCGVLALVPLLGAVVLSYGLVATPATVIRNVQSLTSVMPADAAKLIGEQLANVVTTSGGKKGFGLLIALAIALYGAMKGASAIITSLNIAYDEEETRGFVRLNLTALAITAGAVLVAILAIISIAAMGGLETLFPSAPGIVLVAGRILSYAVMAAVGAAAAATLYRYAPNRDEAKWVWLTPGSVLTTVLWLIVTLGFGFYVSNFGSYDATYGSLGAAIVLLTWLYLSAYILLLGAEFNCELERQTARDTTKGPEKALGTRGAHAADTVASGPDAEPKAGSGPHAAVSEQSSAQRVDEGSASSTGSALREYAVSRATVRGARVAGMEKVGMLPSILATGGLVMLRRKAPAGIALLALGGGLSWLTGRKTR